MIFGLLGGPVVKNPPASTGDVGSIPGLGRSHTLQAAEPVGHNYRAHTPEPVLHNREATAARSPRDPMKSSPCEPRREKAHTQRRRPVQPWWWFGTESKGHKSKKNKWGYVKLKSFCLANETVRKIRRQPTKREKRFASHIPDKRLISKMYKELTQFNSQKKKKKNPIKCL